MENSLIASAALPKDKSGVAAIIITQFADVKIRDHFGRIYFLRALDLKLKFPRRVVPLIMASFFSLKHNLAAFFCAEVQLVHSIMFLT